MGAILIVEDELIEREFLKALISSEISEDYVIFSCSSGTEAVALAKQHQPDIIFMDVLIPEKDGLAAFEEIRGFLPYTKGVVLTAFSDFSYAQKAIELNVSKYLLKPVKPRDVIALLHQLLQEIHAEAEKESPEMKPENISTMNKEEIQDFIKNALAFIQDHYKEKITLQKVAAHVFMNPQYFSRVFKKEIGLSYTDYVNNLRINYACKLLESSDYPSYRISSECGFNDPSYFNRVFFNQMKTTPNRYRKKMHSAAF